MLRFYRDGFRIRKAPKMVGFEPSRPSVPQPALGYLFLIGFLLICLLSFVRI